ncbi:hypothetical protein [Legionella sp. km772]|uniref:hypothetical protein n=1 Tax=Legionella sp. km772 TaxID=2498111 RepID=UPI000F8E23C4|nr:hypothetical protein [Legionella sp. km772]RUR11143.1 hypothetical protein ELY15_07465 [Legionella sp. km772]
MKIQVVFAFLLSTLIPTGSAFASAGGSAGALDAHSIDKALQVQHTTPNSEQKVDKNKDNP